MRINPKEYESKLKNLFKEIFSESIFFTSMIFDEVLNFSDCFIKKDEDEIVSFLFAVQKKVRIYQDVKNCVYIYGVGTKENHRGKGYMKSLINEVYTYYQNKDVCFLYLVPASETLFKMYEHLGFQTEFYLEKKEVELQKNDSVINVQNGNYYFDYCEFSRNFDNVILMSEQDCNVALKYTKYVKINKSGFLLEEGKNTAFIREVFLDCKDDLDDFLKYLGNKFPRAVLTTTGDTPYAMIKPYDNFKLSGTRYTNMNFD